MATRYLKLAAAGFFVMAVAGTEPASAQAWIGLMAGEMAAQAAAAQREVDCMHGVPAAPDDVANSNKRGDKLMEEFFALTSQSSARSIRSLFDTDEKGFHIKNDDGPVTLDQLAALLDEPTIHAKVLSVVGGDNQTMRTIWSAGEGDATVYYGADIAVGNFWNSAKILHLTLSKTMPDAPPAFCHLDPEQSY